MDFNTLNLFMMFFRFYELHLSLTYEHFCFILVWDATPVVGEAKSQYCGLNRRFPRNGFSHDLEDRQGSATNGNDFRRLRIYARRTRRKFTSAIEGRNHTRPRAWLWAREVRRSFSK